MKSYEETLIMGKLVLSERVRKFTMLMANREQNQIQQEAHPSNEFTTLPTATAKQQPSIPEMGISSGMSEFEVLDPHRNRAPYTSLFNI